MLTRSPTFRFFHTVGNFFNQTNAFVSQHATRFVAVIACRNVQIGVAARHNTRLPATPRRIQRTQFAVQQLLHHLLHLCFTTTACIFMERLLEVEKNCLAINENTPHVRSRQPIIFFQNNKVMMLYHNKSYSGRLNL